MSSRGTDFDLRALHEAIDRRRQALDLSWARLTREVNAQFAQVLNARPVSASTIAGLRHRRVVEGDGVLQMLRWLGCPPEAFVPDLAASGLGPTPLPIASTDRVLRWDAAKLHRALDDARVQRTKTWQQVADDVDCGISTVTGMRHGGRVSLPPVMRIVRWVGRPAADFVTPTPF